MFNIFKDNSNNNYEVQKLPDSANELQNFIYEQVTSNIIKYKKKESFEKLYSIRGSAGTGKSWLTSQIIRAIVDDLGLSVAITAPTHKALHVVNDMVTEHIENSYSVIVKTIHSFLNLKLDYGLDSDNASESTKPKLVKNTDKFNESTEDVDVLILDESSMVNEELYNLVIDTLNDRTQIIIFIGDQYQLPPVEGGLNPVFFANDILQYELTQTVRQKEGNLIIELANTIRQYIINKQYIPNIKSIFQENENIIILSSTTFLPKYMEIFKDNDNIMIGAYTNKTVNEYNNYVRYVIENTLDYIVENEVLILQEPYVNSQNVLVYQNGESIEVQTCKQETDIMNGLTIWKVKTTDRKIISILDPISYEEYNDLIDKRLQFAKQSVGKDRRNAWKEYFKLKNRYAKVKYRYASTIHKLQGSSYNNMFFDMRDIDYFYSKDPDQMLRLLYVAVTRAENNFYILK